MTPRCGCRMELDEKIQIPSHVIKSQWIIVHCPRHAEATVGALVEALKNLVSLYDEDEGCRTLPEYQAAQAALRRVEGT